MLPVVRAAVVAAVPPVPAEPAVCRPPVVVRSAAVCSFMVVFSLSPPSVLPVPSIVGRSPVLTADEASLPPPDGVRLLRQPVNAAAAAAAKSMAVILMNGRCRCKMFPSSCPALIW